MWYASLMNQHPIEPSLKEARAAVRHAQDTRTAHRRRTGRGSKQREADITESIRRLKAAMVPLRSFRGSAPFKTQTAAHGSLVERVEQASRSLQSERRKLWKMKDHTNKEKPNGS